MAGRPFKLAVKALVWNAQGRCLLIRRSQSSKHFKGKWEVPGGKVDPGEDFVKALVRETKEETGLTISLRGLAGATEYKMRTKRIVVLLMEARAKTKRVRLSPEHDGHKWVPRKELVAMDLSHQLKEFIESYVKSGGKPRRKRERSTGH